MVRGKSRRVRIYGMRFGENPSPDILVDEGELDKITPEGQEGLVLFGCRPELRDKVLRESPCLVRQEDGRFLAVNTDKQGPAYIVE